MASIRLFKMGADPEFGFVRPDDLDDLVSACDLIEHNLGGRFGLDGHSDIAELRPLPSINPSKVVQNIYDDMVFGYTRNKETRKFYWRAGSYVGTPIGGHIHFGTRGLLRSEKKKYAVRSLDNYLAQIVLLLENAKEVSLRNEEDFGFFSDYRGNDCGGLEYRVLGSWLTSPRVAEGVLALAQTVMYQILWEIRPKCKVRKLKTSPKLAAPHSLGCDGDCSNGEWGEDPCECGDTNFTAKFITDTRKKFPEIRRRIRNFKLYKRHEVAIEFLFRLIEKKKTWFPGCDMKEAWGITEAAPIRILSSVQFNDIWKRARRSR